MERLGIDIGSSVNEDTDILLGGKVGGDSGTLNSLECAELDCGGSHGGTGVTGAHDGIGIPDLDQIDGAGNG